MSHSPARSRLFRGVAVLLLPLQLAVGLPVTASADPKRGEPSRSMPASPPAPTANRKIPKVSPPPAIPVFDDPLTGLEIFRARPFEAPLVATVQGSSVTQAGDAKRKPAPPPRPTANRTVPKVAPPPLVPSFSDPPSDLEIFRARVFEEPLIANGQSSAKENAELGSALLAYLGAKEREDVTAIEAFLQRNPDSAWHLSLVTNLGIVARRTGYFSKALKLDLEAWELGRSASDPRARATADRALAELAELYARLGRTDELAALVAEVTDRDLSGSVSERIAGAKQGLWLMKNRPEIAFRCGPMAVERILLALRPGSRQDPRIGDALSTSKGTSLIQMRDLASRLGVPMEMVRRESRDADLLVPALVHWQAGHFAAIVKEQGGRYLVQDPTFGEEMWVSRAALDAETSGSFLVPKSNGAMPPGWRVIDDHEGNTVWGKGAANGQNPQPQAPPNRHCCQNGQPCPTPTAMAQHTFLTMLAGLVITDRPVGYTPPRGPAINFDVSYSHREAFQPQIFSYANLGPKWTFDWISYVTDDPANQAQTVTVYQRQGGQETHTGFNPSSQSFAPHTESRAVVVRTSTSPIRYERQLPDGSVEVFSQPDGGFSFPRKVFLTELRDPQGNSVQFIYDSLLRLMATVDAIGQVTTLSYDLPTDNLRITRVTDPFGRFATFEYDASGRLSRITDVIGMTSEFVYESGEFVSALTTPYGTTRFAWTQSGADRSLEITDQMGAIERVEYVNGHTPLVFSSDPPSTVPTGFAASNTNLDQAITFYWDKRAMALAPRDYSKAEVTHWLWTNGTAQSSAIPRARKMALENRVWYAYPGQPSALYVGTHAQPITAGRVLDDGTSQIFRYEYNSRGKVTKAIDPVGRETRYTYGTNNTPDPDPAIGTGIDLLKSEQKNGIGYDLLESRTYNSLHQPLTITDASGQTTTYTYNGAGQLLTVTTPARAGITENRTTTYAYDANGYLQSITRPASGATSTYGYDGYGRVRTVTDTEGYTATIDYDTLDRPTKTTYPDGTYEETIYSRLDPERVRDRLGRWTHSFYDALRRRIAVRDPLGRTTTYQWCNCGSLDKVIDSGQNATSWERDIQGRVISETRAGVQWNYVYENTTSRVKTRVDPKLQVITYAYAADDSLTQTTYSNAQVSTPNVSFTYDPIYNRPSTMTDGTGLTTYAYYPVTVPPNLGATQLQSVDGPLANDVVTYSYDELGRITTRGLSTFPTTLGYDVLGRPTSLGSPLGSFVGSYVNTTGRAQSLTYPNGQVTTYSYFNNAGDERLQQIKHQQVSGGAVLSQFDYTYDAVGNIQTLQQQLGASPARRFEFGYDAAGQLTAAVQKDPSTQQILKSYGYTYDLAGNKTADAQDSTATTSQYNTRNELTQQAAGGALRIAGALNEPATVMVSGAAASVSANDQFVGTATLGTGTQTFTVAATDPSGNTRTNTYQVNVSGTPQAFVYDANGNLCAKGGTTCANGTTTYEWDAENRLVSVKQGATTLATFAYDGRGTRVRKIAGGVTHSYVYDGRSIAQERLSSGEVFDLVHGTGIDRPLAQRDQAGVVSYYLADRLGSIAQTTSSAGAITLTREYDPWGNPVQGATVSGFAFTGRDWDAESQLAYYRARYYDPALGRFLSEDPIGFRGGSNLYAYARANPVRYVDPLGLSPSSYIDCLSNCLHTTLQQNTQAFGCNLKTSVIVGAATGAATCIIVVAVEPALLPALPTCLIVTVPSTVVLFASVSFTVYTSQNIGSTLGCLIFCAGSW